MKIERQPRNVEWRVNGGRCSIFHEHVLTLQSKALMLFCHLMETVKSVELSGAECMCIRNDLLLICPLGRQRRRKKKKQLEVGLWSASGGRNRFRPLHTSTTGLLLLQINTQLLAVYCGPRRLAGAEGSLEDTRPVLPALKAIHKVNQVKHWQTVFILVWRSKSFVLI